MSDDPGEDADQLVRLGQQILDELVKAYAPPGDDDHALALFPGQAVPDDLVQGGTTNPLRVSEWIGTAYDFPLELEVATATPVATTIQSGPPLRRAYATAARYGQPAVPPDDPRWQRLADLIAAARRAIGDGTPATMPFGVLQDTFLEPTCTWNPFDTTVTTHAEQTTTTAPPRRANPALWRLRALPEQVVEELPGRVAFRTRRLAVAPGSDGADGAPEVQPVTARELAVNRSLLVRQPEVVEADGTAATVTTSPGVLAAALRPSLRVLAAPAATPTALVAAGRVTALAAGRFRLPDAGPVADAPVRTVRPVVVDRSLAGELATVRLPDLVDAPSTTTVTTADSSLRVQFEHLAVDITRRAPQEEWWHPELLTDPDWYVAGMRAGALVPAADDPEATTCEPLRLVLVRNLSMTGTWTSTASELMTGVHYVGPFLMQLGAASGAGSSQQTVVLGQGTQVIGMVCGPMSPVPPRDDPALDASSPDPGAPDPAVPASEPASGPAEVGGGG